MAIIVTQQMSTIHVCTDGTPMTWNEALVVSFSPCRGRGFFSTTF